MGSYLDDFIRGTSQASSSLPSWATGAAATGQAANELDALIQRNDKTEAELAAQGYETPSPIGLNLGTLGRVLSPFDTIGAGVRGILNNLFGMFDIGGYRNGKSYEEWRQSAAPEASNVFEKWLNWEGSPQGPVNPVTEMFKALTMQGTQLGGVEVTSNFPGMQARPEWQRLMYGLGFEMLTDPLNYLSFGATAGTKAMARGDLAEIAAKGLSAGDLAKLGIDDVAEFVGKYVKDPEAAAELTARLTTPTLKSRKAADVAEAVMQGVKEEDLVKVVAKALSDGGYEADEAMTMAQEIADTLHLSSMTDTAREVASGENIDDLVMGIRGLTETDDYDELIKTLEGVRTPEELAKVQDALGTVAKQAEFSPFDRALNPVMPGDMDPFLQHQLLKQAVIKLGEETGDIGIRFQLPMIYEGKTIIPEAEGPLQDLWYWLQNSIRKVPGGNALEHIFNPNAPMAKAGRGPLERAIHARQIANLVAEGNLGRNVAAVVGEDIVKEIPVRGRILMQFAIEEVLDDTARAELEPFFVAAHDAQNALEDALEAGEEAVIGSGKPDLQNLLDARDLAMNRVQMELAQRIDPQAVGEFMQDWGREVGLTDEEIDKSIDILDQIRQLLAKSREADVAAGIPTKEHLGPVPEGLESIGYAPHRNPSEPTAGEKFMGMFGLQSEQDKAVDEVLEMLFGDKLPGELKPYERTLPRFRRASSGRPRPPEARQLDTLEDWIMSGHLPETDVALSVSGKIEADAINQAKSRYVQSVAAVFGKPLRGKPREGYEVLSFKLNGKTLRYEVPKGIKEVVENTQSAFSTDRELNSMARAWDKVVNFWRRMATTWNPIFHARNAPSNYLLAWIKDARLANPRGWIDGYSVMGDVFGSGELSDLVDVSADNAYRNWPRPGSGGTGGPGGPTPEGPSGFSPEFQAELEQMMKPTMEEQIEGLLDRQMIDQDTSFATEGFDAYTKRAEEINPGRFAKIQKIYWSGFWTRDEFEREVIRLIYEDGDAADIEPGWMEWFDEEARRNAERAAENPEQYQEYLQGQPAENIGESVDEIVSRAQDEVDQAKTLDEILGQVGPDGEKVDTSKINAVVWNKGDVVELNNGARVVYSGDLEGAIKWMRDNNATGGWMSGVEDIPEDRWDEVLARWPESSGPHSMLEDFMDPDTLENYPPEPSPQELIDELLGNPRTPYPGVDDVEIGKQIDEMFEGSEVADSDVGRFVDDFFQKHPQLEDIPDEQLMDDLSGINEEEFEAWKNSEEGRQAIDDLRRVTDEMNRRHPEGLGGMTEEELVQEFLEIEAELQAGPIHGQFRGVDEFIDNAENLKVPETADAARLSARELRSIKDPNARLEEFIRQNLSLFSPDMPEEDIEAILVMIDDLSIPDEIASPEKISAILSRYLELEDVQKIQKTMRRTLDDLYTEWEDEILSDNPIPDDASAIAPPIPEVPYANDLERLLREYPEIPRNELQRMVDQLHLEDAEEDVFGSMARDFEAKNPELAQQMDEFLRPKEAKPQKVFVESLGVEATITKTKDGFLATLPSGESFEAENYDQLVDLLQDYDLRPHKTLNPDDPDEALMELTGEERPDIYPEPQPEEPRRSLRKGKRPRDLEEVDTSELDKFIDDQDFGIPPEEDDLGFWADDSGFFRNPFAKEPGGGSKGPGGGTPGGPEGYHGNVPDDTPGPDYVPTGKTLEIDGQTYTYQEIYDEALSVDAVKGRMTRSEIGRNVIKDVERGGRPTRHLNPTEVGGNVGEFIEDGARLSVYINARRLGMDPTTAAELVNSALYNYAPEALTVAERQYIRRLIPFYTWMRRNIPNMVENLLKTPGKFTWLDKLYRNSIEATGEDPTYFPEWVKDTGAVPLPMRDSAGNRIFWNPNVPQQDLSKLGFLVGRPADTAKDILSAFNPIVKEFLEQSTNKDFFFQEDIDQGYKVRAPGIWQQLNAQFVGTEAEDEWKKLVDLLGMSVHYKKSTGEEYLAMNPRIAKLLRDMSPWLNNLNRMADTTNKAKYNRFANLTGIKLFPYDAEQARTSYEYDRLDELMGMQREAKMQEPPENNGLEEWMRRNQ